MATTAGRVRGRKALTAEQVLRVAVLYQMHQFSFRELAFEMQFSQAYRSFCRLRFNQRPSKTALQRDISRVEPNIIRPTRRCCGTAFAS